MNAVAHTVLPTRSLGALVLCLGLLLPTPGSARTLPAGTGRVDVGPTYRQVGGTAGPGLSARFVWHPSGAWSFGVDAGLVRGGDPTYDALWVGDLALTAALHPVALGPVLPYLSGAAGYHMVAVQGGSLYGEGGTTGASVGVGALMVLDDHLGVFIEDRYRFGWIDVSLGGDAAQTRNLGGNTIWAGLTLLFDPEPPLGY